jgi:hypothetical protein
MAKRVMTERQFISGLERLDRRGKLSKSATRMLDAMLKLGKHAVPPRKYARAMHWKDERGSAAHANFGRLAHRVCDESVPVRKHPEYWVEALFDMEFRPTRWKVKPDIYAALREWTS